MTTALMQRAQVKDVTVDGVNVRYAIAGEGPAVLLVHGLASSMITWYCNMDALADAGFQAIAMDLPGYGDSGLAEHLDYAPESAARFLANFTAELGIDRFSVVGNSAGGLIAGVTALEFPDRVDKVALVAAAGLGASPFLALSALSQYRYWANSSTSPISSGKSGHGQDASFFRRTRLFWMKSCLRCSASSMSTSRPAGDAPVSSFGHQPVGVAPRNITLWTRLRDLRAPTPGRLGR